MSVTSTDESLPLGTTPILSDGDARDFFALLKPRVMSLVVFTALVGMLVAPGHINPAIGFIAILCIAIGGGASGALNMWYDADIDAVMGRTANRPIPAGRIEGSTALGFGLTLAAFSVVTLGLAANWLAAGLLAFTIFFYAVVYTIWLKRSTPQNIVIGGIAGSTPPVIGWAAAEDGLTIATDSVAVVLESLLDLGSLMPWFMFLLIFLWTPPHFWALALYRSEEYGEVGIPMMPNVKGPERTLREMKAYAALLVALSVTAPMSYGGIEEGDSIYHVLGWTCVGLSIWYASTVWRVDLDEQRDPTGRLPTAARSFFVSMLYLALMFIVLVTASFGILGAGFGAALSVVAVVRSESRARA